MVQLKKKKGKKNKESISLSYGELQGQIQEAGFRSSKSGACIKLKASLAGRSRTACLDLQPPFYC